MMRLECQSFIVSVLPLPDGVTVNADLFITVFLIKARLSNIVIEHVSH